MCEHHSLSLSAGVGAEPPTGCPLVSSDNQKSFAATVTEPLDGPVAMVAAHDEQFVVFDLVRMFALGVATMTRRDQIPWLIVPLVAVHMIGDERACGHAFSGSPVNWTFAPMARMWAGTDLVEQHNSVNRDFGWD
jgi:hypothetical protein